MSEGQLNLKVHVLQEAKRGCGYRKPGKDGVGIYLMGRVGREYCERLPFPVGKCPTCGGGIKYARGWTTINPAKIFLPDVEPVCEWVPLYKDDHPHDICPVCTPPEGEHGLVWIGHKHYTVQSFQEEVARVGISRRLPAIPRNLKVGETWVYLAHIKAYGDFRDEEGMTPGVFRVFKPTRVDLVIEDENDIPEKAVRLVERHGEAVRLVKVEKV